MEASRKREERTARKIQREIELRLKQQAKLSELEQARLEVEAFENSLSLLLSIHKEVSPAFDWIAQLCTLPPHALPSSHKMEIEQEKSNCIKLQALARGVLAGDAAAYQEALTELSSFGELSALGSEITFQVHNSKLIACELRVNGREAIPAEAKSLTVAGKVSVKSMPKARFHEIYQDYVCGCVLRAGREIFALLPVETVIATAKVTALQSSTGQMAEIAVLSVAMSRQGFERLDFIQLDPSDSMENFLHRGDVLASRKSGEFTPVEPLKPADIAMFGDPQKLGLDAVTALIREMRTAIAADLNTNLS